MIVKEMHIGVNFLLQKIDSKFIDSFEPEELDWALNEEVLRFVKQRLSPQSNDKQKGFQDGQKRFDDLKPLITNASIPAYVRDSVSVFCYLPFNYLTLINDRTTTKNLCGSPYSSVTTSVVTKYISCLQIKDDPTDLYATFKIRFNGVEVFNITDYPPYATGLPSLSSKFELVNLVQQILVNSGYICKYGSYYDVICNQGIVIVTNTALNIEVEYTPADIVVINSVSSVYNQISPVNGTVEVPNRLTSTENLYELLTSSFGTTIYSDPLSTLEVDKLIVFHNQKFITPTINISYLRKPRKISLSLNQDCDLDEWIQLEIVDNTAKRLAGLISSDNYKQIINENLLKE